MKIKYGFGSKVFGNQNTAFKSLIHILYNQLDWLLKLLSFDKEW